MGISAFPKFNCENRWSREKYQKSKKYLDLTTFFISVCIWVFFNNKPCNNLSSFEDYDYFKRLCDILKNSGTFDGSSTIKFQITNRFKFHISSSAYGAAQRMRRQKLSRVTTVLKKKKILEVISSYSGAEVIQSSV